MHLTWESREREDLGSRWHQEQQLLRFISKENSQSAVLKPLKFLTRWYFINVPINVKGYNKNIHRKINITCSLIDSVESIVFLLLGSRSFLNDIWSVSVHLHSKLGILLRGKYILHISQDFEIINLVVILYWKLCLNILKSNMGHSVGPNNIMKILQILQIWSLINLIYWPSKMSICHWLLKYTGNCVLKKKNVSIFVWFFPLFEFCYI